jgi:transcriptional regulator with XRE-family HTH domain
MRRYKVCVKFGKKIQKQRKKLGLSQEKLAQEAGIHRNHMGRIERGETNPPLYKVYKITKALKVKSSELLSF